MANRFEERRLELHNILKDILGSDNVYYQPPESIKMKYPAIAYNRRDIQNTFANDEVYVQNNSYLVTVIDRDPDSEIVDKVSKMDKTRFDRHFTINDLNHDSFIIFY